MWVERSRTRPNGLEIDNDIHQSCLRGGVHRHRPGELENLFFCEEWSADLATGLVKPGPETARLHGIAGTPCGIMDLIQLYDPADWPKVLQALEGAATASTTFSFATTIRPRPGLHRAVFCFGQSEMADGCDGTIHGTFAIARVCIETAPDRRGRLN